MRAINIKWDFDGDLDELQFLSDMMEVPNGMTDIWLVVRYNRILSQRIWVGWINLVNENYDYKVCPHRKKSAS